jgi:hypothetical protein
MFPCRRVIKDKGETMSAYFAEIGAVSSEQFPQILSSEKQTQREGCSFYGNLRFSLCSRSAQQNSHFQSRAEAETKKR